MKLIPPAAKALALNLRLRLKAFSKGSRLPPGDLDPSDGSMFTDQRYNLKKAEELGAIFKTMWGNQYTTCIVGHARARRMLIANEDSFPGATIDLKGLFPIGALRGMSGEVHAKYRRLFILSLQATPLSAYDVAFRAWMLDNLSILAGKFTGTAVPGTELRATLRDISTGIMMRMLFGIAPGTPDYIALFANYRQFGPHHPVYVIKAEHAEVFGRIRQRIKGLAAQIRRGPPEEYPPSFLKYLVESDSLDETALGNLMYMFEPSHFDLYSLWRWIMKQLVSAPMIMDRVKAAPADGARALCEAIVLETLRLEQGEELYRRPSADVVFEKLLIPKGTIMRARIWEGHKDPAIFPEPFKFDPNRFLGKSYPFEQYAPFGLDKRRCVGADFVVSLSAMFVEILLKKFSISAAGDGPPVFGAYHWEPNPEFSEIGRAHV